MFAKMFWILPVAVNGLHILYVDQRLLLEVAKRLGDLPADHSGSYAVSAEDCKAAFESLDDVSRNSLVNIHSRVKVFAEGRSQFRKGRVPRPLRYAAVA